MDLAYSQSYQQFRDEVQEFLAESRERWPSRQSLGRPSSEMCTWQAMLIERGYTARTVPKEYGGHGGELDILKSRIIAEEFTRAGAPGGLAGQGVSMLVPTLLELGSEEQKMQWIPKTLSGEVLWCQGYSEPGAGSDLASLQTRATEDGDDFIINGQKIWTSTAHEADMIFCLVRTEPDAPKHKGISYLLFPMATSGIEVRPLKTMTGHAEFNEVFFTDVRVPQKDIVGERGQGWMVANSTLKHERGMLGDPNQAGTRLNAIIKMMREETVDGTTLMENPVMRDRLLKLQARVLAMQFNGMRLLTGKLKKENPGIAGLIVKLQGCELNHQLAALAIDVMGELGILYGDTPRLRNRGIWQRSYMFDLGLIIGGGTAQIQKNIIAEWGLQMPREPKPATVATGGAS
ncbi:MAG: acyl-CoA dehydrogenase [Halieaceae bacterium]|jgi:alkylation response protein AidB-like acyl-CoA dehydrogenase|nr:acyl-CoA dehydrogenase [Halieaceae bacterium]